MNQIKLITEWVIKELQKNGPQSSSNLCKKYADLFFDVNYDTIRMGIYTAGKLDCISKTKDKKFVYCGKKDTL